MIIHQPLSRLGWKNILFATDFEASSMRALPFAVALAQRHGAKLLVAHVIPQLAYAPHHAGSLTDMLQEERDCAEYKLHQILLSLRQEGCPCETFVEVGDPGDVLQAMAEGRNADLIVLGTSSRGGLGKLMVGSVAEQIIREASCLVLTIGPHVVTQPDVPFRNILCAVDFSSTSLRAVTVAGSLAEFYQVNLTLVHVLEGEGHEVSSHAVQAQRERLRGLLPPRPSLPRARLKVMVKVGSVAQHIVTAGTEQPPDLIVMGAQGAGAFGQTTSRFGSIVHKTISCSACPVLTVGHIHRQEDSSSSN